MEVIANSDELLQFSVQSEIYSEAVLFKSLYWLTARAGFDVFKPRPGTFLISVRPLDAGFSAKERTEILARIRTNLVDFKVREVINAETALIRNMIIAKAFSHEDLSGTAQNQAESNPPNQELSKLQND